MDDQREVTLWPTRENYPRFRAVCDDEVPDTFDEFEAQATAGQAEIEARYGIRIERVDFDPDRLAQWCRVHFGKVNAEARVAYALFITDAH